jgi:SagB-type dehydrogenase family enzyme
LAGYLASRLPSYLVPTSFTFLDALPLSANAKVDKGRLPAPETAGNPVAGTVAVVADDPEEVRLLQIVAHVLDRPAVAPDANLMLLGATSIDIVRIANASEAELGFRPRLADLMRAPTLANLLGLYRDRGHAATARTAAAAADPAPPLAGPTGVDIDDPAARSAFKSRGLGRRTFVDARPFDLAPTRFSHRYADLRSVRRFSAEPVPARALGELLACLSEGELDGAPKYQYASAGGTYPIQTYCFVKPGRITGLPGGAYYHDPAEHRLLLLGEGRELSADAYDYFVNRPVFEAAAFGLFLVAELAAIEPLYGEVSHGFCQIEAGGMAQLLTMSAAEVGLGLCGMGSVEADLAALFDLGPTHRLVYSMVGGSRPVALPHARLASLAEMEDFEV